MEDRAEAVARVFEYWKQLLGHSRSRLDQKRRRKIEMRLSDGYEEQDLIDAIIGCANSPFHRGENERHTRYDDIELILRDATHVDKFVALAEKKKARDEKEAADRQPRASVTSIDIERARSNVRRIKDVLKGRVA